MMEQDMIDWTAFLTDEPWYLPDPPPAGSELPGAPPVDVETWPSQDELSNCPQHPSPSTDCCWRRRPLNDSFFGVEEEVASLGHFGVGFPEGHYPATVEGTFTGTGLEYGRPSSVLDGNILDKVHSQGSDAGCFLDGTGAKASHEDERQSQRSLAMPEPVEVSREEPSVPNLTMKDTDTDAINALTPSKEHAVCCEPIPDSDTARLEQAAAAACPTATAPDQCTMYQAPFTHERAEKPASNNYDEESDDWAGPAVEVTRWPRKYQRKRKLQDSSKTSRSIKLEQDDSDSDYAPDPRKKKRAGPNPTTTYKTPPATAKKPRELKSKKVWYAKNSSPAPTKPRINAKKPTRARETTAASASYAPVANTARFATTATRAQYALDASTIRPQPGVQYGEVMEDAQIKFCRLQEEFEGAKLHAPGSGRHVQQVDFADKAGDATFARYAKAAEMIIKIG